MALSMGIKKATKKKKPKRIETLKSKGKKRRIQYMSLSDVMNGCFGR